MLDITDSNILLPPRRPGAFMYGSDLKNALRQPKGDVHEGFLKDVVSIIKRVKKDTVIEPINRTSLAEKLRDARIFHGSAPRYSSSADKAKWEESLQEYLKDVTDTHNKYKDKVPKGKRILRPVPPPHRNTGRTNHGTTGN
jgi:hypothetical protein